MGISMEISKDILEKLDVMFAATPLRSADEEVAEVVEVLNASVGFVYGARNGTADDKGAQDWPKPSFIDSSKVVHASNDNQSVCDRQVTMSLAAADSGCCGCLNLPICEPWTC